MSPPSPRIFTAFVLAGLQASSLSAQGQSPEAQIDRYLKTRVPSFSGVVLVARDDTVLFERGYGLADADLGVPIRTDMRFGIASVTKPITAAAAMRLVERRKLSLTDSICRYIKDCPELWSPVTLEHLLSHTSGIPDLFGDVQEVPVEATRAAIDATIARYTAKPKMNATPGESYAYSNFGYFLVAYAMEVVVGSPWQSILQQEIFGPAGMRDTEYDDVWRILPGRVRGYTWREGELRHIEYGDHGAYAAGGLISSARDLLSFSRAFQRGVLLTDQVRQDMLTVRRGEYALGWQVTRVLGRAMQNHTGGTNGFSSHLAHYQDGPIIIVMSNVEAEPAKATACNVAAILFGLQPSMDVKRACRTDP
jgi:CubicO group peptidase (beta-lactamase class C family)